MIISASRRTDIPMLYSEWFANRLKAGCVRAVNPMNHKHSEVIELSSAAVDCIVFWTKDPSGMTDKLDLIDKAGIGYYFLFTVTSYDKRIEPGIRDKNEIIKVFCRLSDRLGKERVVWRYDPILLDDCIDAEFHYRQFESICGMLQEHTDRCIISFADIYRKTKHAAIREMTENEHIEISGNILRIAMKYGIPLYACSEKVDLSHMGIKKSSCIDREKIETICGRKIMEEKDRNQRKECESLKSRDIGAYDTCIGGCVYCYANRDATVSARYHAGHDAEKENL